MTRINNYAIQAQQAKQLFLTYDQQQIIDKCRLASDSEYIYVNFLCKQYRIRRRDAFAEYQNGSQWLDGNSFEEVMTLLDLVCDSWDSRFLTGKWKNMTDFGLMFHRNLLENARDPWAEKFEAAPDAFRAACEKLGGKAFPQGDMAYAIELFDGLSILVQLWFGDEEFPASLRFLWDENALMYIRYETMYFAKGLLLQEIEERM